MKSGTIVLNHGIIRFSRTLICEENFTGTKTVSRKGKLLLLAIVCVALIFGVATLIESFLRNDFQIEKSTISQICSKPTDWEGKTVKVDGTVEDISLGIVQPFNYWLCDRQNQTVRIGLKWHSDTNFLGRSLTVVGVLKKGYAWVNPNYPGWWAHHIEATSIYQN